MKVRRRYNPKSGNVYYTVGYSKVYHREDGPAIIDEYGTSYWIRYGEYHRKDGPAITYSNGDVNWWLYGKRHRDGGPSSTLNGIGSYWYKNDLLHREDGPAIEYTDGKTSWYKHGIRFLNKEAWFESLSEDQKEKMLYSEYFIRY
jgi:hypothetical protein